MGAGRPTTKTRRARRQAVVAVLAAAGLVVSLGACGGDDDDDDGGAAGGGDSTATLDGTEWTLDAESLDVEVPESVVVTIAFADDLVSGNSGCNTYRGSYEASDGTIEIGTLASTLMACEDDVAAVEQAYLTAMGSVTAYTVDADTLALQDAEGADLLRFTSGVEATSG